MAIILTIQPTDSIQNYLDILNENGGGILNLNPTDTFFPESTLMMYDNTEINGNGATIDFGGNPYQILIQGNTPYTTGTVSVNFGSSTVTGVGTTWTSEMIGQSILIGDYWYEIISVSDTTHLSIQYSDGNGFIGTNVFGVSYVIANTINGVTLGNMLITNSSVSVIRFRYVNGLNINTPTIINSAQAIDGDDSANVNLQDGYTIDNCAVGITYDNVPFCVFKSGLISNITAGTGIALNGVTNTALDSLSIQAITGVGSKLTNCSNFAYSAFSIIGCTSHGLELVSGNTDVDIISGYANSCGGDGIKLTTSSSRNSISSSSFLNNTGWGINIANASDSKNIIFGCNFTNNTAGNLQDIGTNTIASGNEGVANIPSSSGVTAVSIVTTNGMAGSSSGGSTPAITLSTTITGIVKANGTAFSAAVNSDLPAMSATVGGAVPTPPNNTTTFLRGDGTFAAPGGSGSSKQIVTFTGGLTNSPNTTAYIGISTSGIQTTEAIMKVPWPLAGTIKNLYIQSSSTQSATGTQIFTMRKNGVDQTVTITISTSSVAGTFSDTTHSFSVVAGDIITIKDVSGSGSQADICALTCEFDPT